MDEKLQRLYLKIIEDSSIKEFINSNNIDDEMFQKSYASFKTVFDANKICSSCKGDKCNLEYEYMIPSLEKNGNIVIVNNEECSFSSLNNKRLQTIYFPQMDDIENKDSYKTEERAKCFEYMSEFLNGETNKGIYLYGKYGTGKTFLFYKLANEISKKNKNVIICYYPDLIRYLKNCISDGTLEKEIVRLKKVDVLFLDDIGGENNSSFVRDELLCPILQYRLLENKPTFMTSNYDIELLRSHFMETKDDTNQMASDRIIERIRALMNIVELKGENLR